MFAFHRSLRRPLASLMASIFLLLMTFGAFPLPAQASPKKGSNGVNVILMIGDGMGWEAARAGAASRGYWYTKGKGKGLSFQTLPGYTFETTWGTTVATAVDQQTSSATGNTALTGTDPITGKSPVRPGFAFNPAFNPGFLPATDLTAGKGCTVSPGGNIVGYEPNKGGPNPWTPISPPPPGADGPLPKVPNYNRNYIKCSYPDSANTATTLYTGEKTYNNAIAVDLYEQNLETILQTATKLGKSTGVVTSVPITHATPGAAQSSVNRRNKYDNDYPNLDNILQEAIRPDLPENQRFLPTVLLGGGHPLDFENATPTSTVEPKGFTYIKQSTYEELRGKPTANRYGYQFLERDTKVTKTNDLRQIVDGGNQLLATAKKINPNQGQRLLGLYGARGQNGNLPALSAESDYNLTGLDSFAVNGGGQAHATQTINPDKVRPLATAIGETDAQFIAKEVKANPTLQELTAAALEVLNKDKDGFWLMVEGGDIDWALHDNNLDNLIGTVNSFDAAVQYVIDWIPQHGGWGKNVLIVTADHDHYWTLNNNLPQLLGSKGAKYLTYGTNNPAEAGYFTGSDPAKKYGWNSHSNRPAPVYFKGGPLKLERYIGQPVEFVDNQPGGTKKVYTIPGVPGMVDQSHIYKAMVAALKEPCDN